MNAPRDRLRWQLRNVHALVDPRPLAARGPLTRYGEAVVLEDVTVQTVLVGCVPLALSTWRGRTGLTPLPPLGRCWTERNWANTVVIDAAELHKYARAVYAATDVLLT